MPATVDGTSETMSARSRFFPFCEPLPVPIRLMSQKTPAARKPFGATMEPGICLNFAFIENYGAQQARGGGKSNEPRGLGESAEDVHALHGLAAGAFDEVVLGAHDNEPSGPRIESPGDFDDVRANDSLGVGQRFAVEPADERFIAVS